METVVMPKMSDMMTEGKILSWYKKPGDIVKKGEALAEVETEKVNIEIESYVSGVLLEIVIPAGNMAPVGEAIAYVGEPSEKKVVPAAKTAKQEAVAAAYMASTAASSSSGNSAKPAAPESLIPAEEPAGAARIKASPLARRLAEEYHINLADLRGTGPDGRIIRGDVEAAFAAQKSGVAQSALQAISAAGLIGEQDDILPLSNMRRVIARRLQESSQTAPHFYVTVTMEAGRMAALRAKLNAALEQKKDSLRISVNDIIVAAVAHNLAQHPEVNAYFLGDRIARKHDVHVGVAVALESGLIVPVVRNADKRSLSNLAREIRRLTDAARSNKLKPDEFSGGTFTVSNLGMLDVESFTAIINPPESAILAVGAVTATPVVENGAIVARDIMKMTLSSDHRAIDGAQAAYFMRDLKRLIETPDLLLL